MGQLSKIHLQNEALEKILGPYFNKKIVKTYLKRREKNEDMVNMK